MKKYFFVLLFFVWFVSLINAQENMKIIDNGCARILHNKPGVDNSLCHEIERIIYAKDSDDSFRREAEQKLLAVFPKATPNGQLILYRLLIPLGSEAAVPVLEPLMASQKNNGEEGQLARSILECIAGKEVDRAFLRTIPKVQGNLLVGVLAGIGRRRIEEAVPQIAPLAESNDPNVAVAAIRALGSIGNDEAIRILEQLKTKGRCQVAVKDALICANERQGIFIGNKIVPPYKDETAKVKQFSAVFFTEQLSGLKTRFDKTGDIAENRNLLNDMVPLINQIDRPVDYYNTLLTETQDINVQKAILEAVSNRSCTKELTEWLIEIMQRDEHLRPNAGLAAVRILNSLKRTDPYSAERLLQNIIERVNHRDVEHRALSVLIDMQKNNDIIMHWTYCGPFCKAGVSGRALFDLSFDKELETAKWTPLKSGWQQNRLWNMSTIPDWQHNSSIYLKTSIISDRDQKLRCQAATSTAVKIYCNTDIIFGTWRAGPFHQWEIDIPIMLKKGKNSIMVKIDKAAGDTLFSLRLRDQKGLKPIGILNKTN